MRSNGISLCHFGMTVVIALFVTIVAHAQAASPSPTPDASPSLEHEFLKNILRDQKAIWTAPFNLKHDDMSWLAPIGIGTAALIVTDQQTGDELAESHRQLSTSRVISYGGGGFWVAATAGAGYFFVPPGR